MILLEKSEAFVLEQGLRICGFQRRFSAVHPSRQSVRDDHQSTLAKGVSGSRHFPTSDTSCIETVSLKHCYPGSQED